MASVLDWALIIIYMLSMVGVGMYFKTDDSMQDFAVADKKLGLSVMTATMPGDCSWWGRINRKCW